MLAKNKSCRRQYAGTLKVVLAISLLLSLPHVRVLVCNKFCEA